MSWLLLMLACSGKEAAVDSPDSGVTADDSRDDSPADSPDDSSAPEVAAFANPAEAEDLDPAEGSVRFALTAAAHTQLISDPYTGEVITFEGAAYNGQTPGPTLRAQVGDRFELTLDNQLTQATTIHWHGLEVPFAMDGVTWRTDPIGAGEQFTYSFTLTQAGTFWYHPHFNTDQQVDNGLYGVLIVEDPADPVVDRELVMVFDDWSLPTALESPPHGEASDTHGVDGSEGLWAVNGLVRPRLELDGGEVVRVRVLSAANSGYVALSWPDMMQIGGDQGLLAAPLEPERVVFAPGDRADFEWRPAASAFEVLDHPYAHSGGQAVGEPAPRLSVVVNEPAAVAESPAWPFPGGEVSEDPGYTDQLYVFTGELEGPWLINGETFPQVEVLNIPKDRPAILEIRNLAASEHPFHLHGMHFEVLSVNGVPPSQPTIEDTWNLAIRDALRVRVQPTEPGYWMLHCHILEHADDGMMTVLEVVE